MCKNNFSIVAALWFMGVSVMQSQNYAHWLRQNKTQQQYLEEQIKTLKFYSYQSQRGYDRIQKGLMIFAALEDQAFQQHHSHFESQGKLSSAFYTKSQLKKLQSEHNSLCQFITHGIKNFEESKINTNPSLVGLRWSLWKLLRNGQRQLQVLEKLIDSNYFLKGDGDHSAKIEKQKLEIKNQHNQLKALYVQFIMLSLQHNSN